VTQGFRVSTHFVCLDRRKFSSTLQLTKSLMMGSLLNEKDTTKSYKVVSIGADFTGNKMIDEIYFLAAYANSKDLFRQYVMPYREVSARTTKTHGIKVQTVFGRFRELRDLRSRMTLNTKTAYSSVTSFMEWMKKLNEGSDGVILIHHDYKISIVPFLMAILDEYKLTDDFFEVVKGFVSINEMAIQLGKHPKKASLGQLVRAVLDTGDGVAKVHHLDRADKKVKLIYDVAAKLLMSDSDCTEEFSSSALLPFLSNREQELVNLEKRKSLISKVKTLGPIFAKEMKKGPEERRRATTLREYLISIEADYGLLKSAYNSEGREGLLKLFEQVEDAKEKKHIEDLLNLMVIHFGGVSTEGEKDSKGKSKAGSEVAAATEGGIQKRKSNRRKRVNTKKQAKVASPKETPPPRPPSN